MEGGIFFNKTKVLWCYAILATIAVMNINMKLISCFDPDEVNTKPDSAGSFNFVVSSLALKIKKK